MIQVSETAKDAIHQEVIETREKESELYRLMKDGNSFALELGSAQEGDVVISHQETPILAIPSDVASLLEGVVIDLHEDDEGPRLVLKPTAA
jgi:Fe-S cluster assembly iron-binding protein IscA